MKIIIFDGMSGAGKTTLRYKILYKFDFNAMIIDRFTPSTWVYDRLAKRELHDISQIELIMNQLNCNLILCYCNPKLVKERRRVDELRESKFSSEDEYKMFKEYEKASLYKSIVIIDTSNKSINDSVEEIYKKINLEDNLCH